MPVKIFLHQRVSTGSGVFFVSVFPDSFVGLSDMSYLCGN